MQGKKKTTPKGYHRMPDGKMMKGASHKESARHEKTESKAEKRAEYGPAPKKKAVKKKTTSKAVRRQNMDY
jgi:hypothetical protein